MPRAAQAMAMSRCRWVGAAMVTASTPRSIRPSRSAKAVHLRLRATCSRVLRSGSTTPTSKTPGSSASTRAWFEPITPTPTTPIRNAPCAPAFSASRIERSPTQPLRPVFPYHDPGQLATRAGGEPEHVWIQFVAGPTAVRSRSTGSPRYRTERNRQNYLCPKPLVPPGRLNSLLTGKRTGNFITIPITSTSKTTKIHGLSSPRAREPVYEQGIERRGNERIHVHPQKRRARRSRAG